jgi:hypothetical protein
MYHAYVRPLLPKMHYVEPLLVRQVESLRFQATSVVAARLGRTEPSLGKEVVEYMLDHRSHLWSMRRSKANFFRLVAVLSGLIAVGTWFELVRSWQHVNVRGFGRNRLNALGRGLSHIYIYGVPKGTYRGTNTCTNIQSNTLPQS